MFFHGVSDPWFFAKDTFNYYQKMTEKNGGPDRVQAWSQFYFVPGMGHCSGGEQALDNFDMLSALVDWVENDRQPESVVATGDNMPGVSRPLCPHPKVAYYNGSGDRRRAGSFYCNKPEGAEK